MNFIGTLGLLLLATTLTGHWAHRLGIPAVIGEILTGVLLGPAILNWVHLDNLTNTFANLGVIILMFLGGLESNLKLLRRYLRPAIIVAIIGVIFPVVLMGGMAHEMHFNWFAAIFIGVIFSATSVSISVAVLKEYRTLNTKEGATILGAAVADDIIGVILLSIMISLMGSHSGSSAASQSLSLILLEQALFFVAVYFLVKWLAPYLMAISDRLLMVASSTIMAMVICLGMAWLAELVGLSGAVGAFFAGIAVANTNYRETVDISIEPLGYAVFIPLFFASVGLEMTFQGIQQVGPFILIMTILGVLTKWLGCGLGARLNGFGWHSSSMVGCGMVSRGEMALITAQIGFQAHLLASTYYSAIILIIILVTLIAPFLLKWALRTTDQSGVQSRTVRQVENEN